MGLLSPVENFLNIPADTLRGEQQQEFNESEFRHNSDYSTKLARQNYAYQVGNYSALAVRGAKASGLSPLAAVGAPSGSMTPTAAAAKGVNMSHSPSGGDSLSELAGLQASIRSLNAKANKDEAEAGTAERNNQRMDDADATAQANLQRMFADLEKKYKDNPEKLEAIKTLGSSDMSASVGTLEAMRNFSNLSAEMPSNLRRISEENFTKALYDEMMRNEAFKDKAKMSKLEFEHMAQEIYKQAQEIVNLRLQALNIAQDTSTKESQQDLNYATIEKLSQEVINLYHGDWASMWKNKDYSSMFIRLAAESTKTAAAGAGYAVGSRVVPGGRANGAKLLNDGLNKAKKQTDVFKKGISSNGSKALSPQAAHQWSDLQKWKHIDPDTYKVMVKGWQKKYGAKSPLRP